jgi:predicted AlkP superfamily phosphohydrolase/phosphomutase
MQLRDPLDGRLVVDQVLRQQDAYQGDCSENAPDLTITMRGLSYITRQGYEFGVPEGEIFAPPKTHESGSHRIDGMLVMAGPKVIPCQSRVDGARLIDITPTVLNLLDCPIPSEVDGRVLTDWVNTGHKIQIDDAPSDTRRLTSPDEGFSPEDEENVVNRLKELGYLE